MFANIDDSGARLNYCRVNWPVKIKCISTSRARNRDRIKINVFIASGTKDHKGKFALLLELCFLREASERANGSDWRADNDWSGLAKA
jgi:hypothetical protein